MECAGRSLVGAGRSQPLSAGTAGSMENARGTGAGAVGKRVSGLRRAASRSDGPWHSVVEYAGARRTDRTDVVADEARHRAALERTAVSADAGQGGTLSRRTGASAARPKRAAQRTVGLAGSVSPGTQLCAPPRSA